MYIVVLGKNRNYSLEQLVRVVFTRDSKLDYISLRDIKILT